MPFLVSVIIPTYNRAGQLKDCLASLFNQTYKKFEVIIVDDGSTDGTESLVKFLQKKYKYLKYLKQKNKGPAAARNLGVEKSKGSILAFTDDDCIVSKTWLENASKSDFQIVGGKTDVLDYASSLVFKYLAKLSIMEKGKIIFLPTNNLAVKRFVFKKVGLFDETNPNAAGEDTEWCWRAFKKNFSLKLNQNIEVMHNYNPSLKDFIKKSYRYGKGNYLAKLKFYDHPKLKDIIIGEGFYFQIFKNFFKSLPFAYVHSRLIRKKRVKCFLLLVLFVWVYNLGLVVERTHIT